MSRASTAEEFSSALTLTGQGRLSEVLARARSQLTVTQYGARSEVKRVAVVFVHGAIPAADLKAATREASFVPTFSLISKSLLLVL
jgi:hypothetical protein